MFQNIFNIGAPLRPAEELSHPTNFIKAGSEYMEMRNITIKAEGIGMAVDFGYSVVCLSNCLPEVIATRVISSVGTDMEFKVKN